jgi:CubicO group peptidase (beta-lactamase class C family)
MSVCRLPLRGLSQALVLCLLSSSLRGLAAQDNTRQLELDRTLTAIAARRHLPGFAVAVVAKDGILFQHGYGFADIANAIPYTPRTLQHNGSIAKTLLGVSLMQLVEQGRLGLDDPINKHLPFQVVNPHFPTDVITIRHLATHTSTLTDTDNYWFTYVLEPKTRYKKGDLPAPYDEMFDQFKDHERVSMEVFVRHIATKQGDGYSENNFLNAKPGTMFAYSNLGADLAGVIVEHVTRQSYEAFTRDRILKPIGMADSRWSFFPVDRRRQALLYVADMRVLPRYDLNLKADGGLLTSVADMSKYLREVIKAYHGESRLLRRESVRLMMSPQATATGVREGDLLAARGERPHRPWRRRPRRHGGDVVRPCH